MLRCVQLGLSIADLDLLSIGMVKDMCVEAENDRYEYDELATQEDIERV